MSRASRHLSNPLVRFAAVRTVISMRIVRLLLVWKEPMDRLQIVGSVVVHVLDEPSESRDCHRLSTVSTDDHMATL